jgi:hypothetical protein
MGSYKFHMHLFFHCFLFQYDFPLYFYKQVVPANVGNQVYNRKVAIIAPEGLLHQFVIIPVPEVYSCMPVNRMQHSPCCRV